MPLNSIAFEDALAAAAPPPGERPILAIQARMGSTRLPGKVMAELGSTTVLEWVVERAKAASLQSGVFVLTSDSRGDDVIAEAAAGMGVRCSRGSEDDVLSRFVALVQKEHPPGVVRVTADCPFVDPEVIDAVVKAWWFEGKPAEYASNTLKRTFPDGLDVEVVSSEILDRLDRLASGIHREHVTSYITSHSDSFECVSVELDVDCSSARVTVDTEEDLEELRRLAGRAPHPLAGPRLEELLAHFGCASTARGSR